MTETMVELNNRSLVPEKTLNWVHKNLVSLSYGAPDDELAADDFFRLCIDPTYTIPPNHCRVLEANNLLQGDGQIDQVVRNIALCAFIRCYNGQIVIDPRKKRLPVPDYGRAADWIF